MSPRKKAPPKPKKYPQRAPKNNYFSTLCDTEEGKALRMEWSSKPSEKRGRPVGVPDGHTLETIKPIRERAKSDAKRIVTVMADKYDIEDDYQKEALETAVEVMRQDGQTRERLQAARLVLDFTKSKPATKSDVSISKAEDFLVSLLDEEEKMDGQAISKDKEKTTH